jgi:hypothetical protein
MTPYQSEELTTIIEEEDKEIHRVLVAGDG